MSGKGSSPRPFSVDQSIFDQNWNRIFANKETAKFEQAILRNEYYDELDTIDCIQYVVVSPDEPQNK